MMAQQVGVLEITLLANMAKLSQDMNRAERVVGDATGKMERHIASAQNAMNSLGVGVGIAALTDQLRRATDAYVKLDAQVRINTKSQEQYNKALDDIHRIANTAQADIAATSMLYTRLKSTMDGSGVTMKQIATVTETVTYGLKAYGATSAEAASASLQLSQAMGSGRLGGEEFRAVMEAMPNVMKVLAESMGVPLGQLRDLSMAGKITAEEMVKAFGDETVANKFRLLAKESMTITGAFQVLRNEFTLYVGEAGKTSGATAAMVSSITFLAENLDTIGKLFLLQAAIIGGKFAASLVESTVAYGTLVAAQEAAIAENLALAEARMVETAATEAQIAATRAGTACALTTLPTTKALTAAQAELTAARALDAAASLKWSTSITDAVRLVGSSIARFVVAHPFIALAVAIGTVVTAIANWEDVTRAGKAIFEGFKTGLDALQYAIGATGISLGNMVMQFQYFMANKSKLFSSDANDRAAFAAEIKRLDALSEAQKTELAGRISGHTAAKKADEEAAAKLKAQVSKDWQELNMTKAQQREKDIADMTAEYEKAAKLAAGDKAALLKLGEEYNVKMGVINEKYNKEAVAAAKKQENAIDSLMAKIKEKTAQVKEEAQGDEHLTDIAKERIRLDKEIAEVVRKNKGAKREALDAAKEELLVEMEKMQVRENWIAFETAAAQRASDATDRIDKSTASLRQEADAIREKTKEIGKTASEVEALRAVEFDAEIESQKRILAIHEEGGFITEKTIKLRELIAAMEDVKAARTDSSAAKAEYEEQKKILDAEKERYKMIDNLAHDTFMNVMNKGKNAFKEIGASIKTYLLEMLYKMTVQKWLLNIGVSAGGSIAGQAGATALGGGGADGGGMSLGTVGSAISIAGSTFGTGVMTALTNGAGMMGNLSAAGSLIGTGTAGGIGAGIGMAMPYVAGALLVASALGAFKKGGGPKVGDYGIVGESGYSPIAGGASSGGDPLGIQKLTENLYAQVKILENVAGKQFNNVTIQQGYDFDPEGTAGNRGSRQIRIGGQILGGASGGGASQFWGSAAEGAKALSVLNTSDLQALIKELNDPKLSATATALMANFGELEKSFPAWVAAQDAQKSVLLSIGTDEEKLAARTEEVKRGFAALGLAMPKSTEEFYAMVKGLDMTTDAGMKQATGMLALKDVLIQVDKDTRAAAEAEQKRQSDLKNLMDDVAASAIDTGLSELGKQLSDLTKATAETIKKAQELKASEEQLAKIRATAKANADAMVVSAAQSAWSGLMSASGSDQAGAQYGVENAQITYDRTLKKVAELSNLSLIDAQDFITKAGSVTAAVAAYWNDLQTAGVGMDDPRRDAIIAFANAASVLATANKHLDDVNTKAAADAIKVKKEADDKAAELAKQEVNLDIALMDAQGKSAEALQARRNAELDVMDASLRTLQESVWAAQDAAALVAKRQSWQDQLDILTGKKTKLQLDREHQLAAETDKTTIAIMKQVFALEDLRDAPELAAKATDAAMDTVKRAIDAQKKTTQIAIDVAKEHVTAIQSVMGALADGIKTLRNAASGTMQQSAAAGMNFITNALQTAQATGYLPDSKQLQDAIGATTAGFDAKLYTSQRDADRDRLRMANQLDALNAIGGDQLTKAQSALSIAEDQLRDLDAQLAAAQTQIDVMRGIDASVQTVTSAIAALGTAISAEAAARASVPVSPVGAPTTAGSTTTAAAASVNPELEANKAVVAAMSNTTYNAAVAALGGTSAFTTQGSVAYQAIVSDPRFTGFAIGTSYVPYDMTATIHEGEEITPRPYVDAQQADRDRTNALLDCLLRTCEQQTADIADLKRTNRLIWQIEDKWDIDGIPATRV